MQPGRQDQVERTIVVKATREQVYAALTDPAQLTKWWAAGIEGGLRPGDKPLLDFGEYGKCRFAIVAATPHSYFAYRWAQGVASPEQSLADPLSLPTTLVEFRIEEVPGGTRVTVRESGLASLPPENYDRATPDGVSEGWGILVGLLEKYLGRG